MPELVIPWLAGYENSSPVRIGNAAAQQLQIDIFGEVADAVFQALKAGMKPSKRADAMRSVIFEHLTAAWRERDEGIWEVRGGRQHFVHSKLMAWVASIAQQATYWLGPTQGNDGVSLPTEIHAEICERGFNSDLNSFVQAYNRNGLMQVCC